MDDAVPQAPHINACTKSLPEMKVGSDGEPTPNDAELNSPKKIDDTKRMERIVPTKRTSKAIDASPEALQKNCTPASKRPKQDGRTSVEKATSPEKRGSAFKAKNTRSPRNVSSSSPNFNFD